MNAIRSNISLLRLASAASVRVQKYTVSALVPRQAIRGHQLAVFSAKRLFSQTTKSLAAAKPDGAAEQPEPERENIYEQFQNINEKKLKKYIAEEKKHDAKLVYVGSLTNQLLGTKFLSLSSSVLGICLTPVLMQTMTEQSLFSKLFVYTTCGFFIFVTPLAFQILTRKYVTRLYYNYQTQTFTAVLYNFFLMEYTVKFKLSQIHVPDVPGLFTTMIANMSEKDKRKLFVDYNLINDVELVSKMLGYDKPLDLDKFNK